VVEIKVDDDRPIDIMLEVGYESHFSHLRIRSSAVLTM
jgi:hypothetical protein